MDVYVVEADDRDRCWDMHTTHVIGIGKTKEVAMNIVRWYANNFVNGWKEGGLKVPLKNNPDRVREYDDGIKIYYDNYDSVLDYHCVKYKVEEE